MPYTKTSTSRGIYTRKTLVAGVETVKQTSYSLISSRTGDAVRGFKDQIKSGGSATGALTAYRQSANINEGICSFVYKDGSKHTNINGAPETPAFALPVNQVPTDVVDAAVASATAKAYSHIREKQTPFEGQTFLAELKDTVKMLRRPFKGIARIADGLLDRRPKTGAAKSGRGIAEQWLEAQMGIIPLVHDTVAILELLEVIASKESRDTFRVYGFDERETFRSAQSGLTAGTTGITCTYEKVYSVKAENIIRFGIDASVIDSAKWTHNSLIDSIDDISSVPITMWEMIPWSFLVDYFVNVGDIIASSMTSQHGVSYVSNSIIKTYTQTRTVHGYTISRPDLIKSIYATTPHVITTKVREVSRSGTLGAIPPLVFSLPGSNTRYANIAALVSQSLLR